MEKETNYIVAIDMGTSNVVTLVGCKAEDGKIAIIASSCSPANGIVRGDIRNIDQIVRSVQESLNIITKEHGIKICEAYIGLSGQHIKCQQHDGYVFITNSEQEVREDDVYKLSDSMRNIDVPAGEQIIHILPQNYILDDDPDINHPVGMIGKRLEGVFNIVTGERRSINLVERCLERVDVDFTEVILNALASAEAVLVDDEKELGVAVIDIGGGTCDVCVYYDKTIRYLGIIPIGGNIINKDIKSYGVLERHVEKLKIKFGSALSDNVPDNQVITLSGVNGTPSKEIPQKVLASIIEARMLDVIDRVNEIIDDAGFRGRLSAGIVLTGGCAQLKDIDKLFAKHLDCDVRIATPDLYVTPESVDLVKNPTYSTAVGLLLKGLMIGKNTKIIVLNTSKPLTDNPSNPVVGAYPLQTRVSKPVTTRETKPYSFNGKDNNPNSIVPVTGEGQSFDDDDPDPVPTTTDDGGKKKWFGRFVDNIKKTFEPGDEEADDNELI